MGRAIQHPFLYGGGRQHGFMLNAVSEISKHEFILCPDGGVDMRDVAIENSVDLDPSEKAIMDVAVNNRPCYGGGGETALDLC